MKFIRHHYRNHSIHFFYGLALIVSIIAIFYLSQSQSTIKQQLGEVSRELQELSGASTTTCRSRNTWDANTTRTYQLQSGGVNRQFLIHLPKNFDTEKQYPVILVFTGKGEQASTIEQAFGINSLNAITIYPQATLGKDQTTAWQGAPYSSKANDVTFVNDILDKVEGQLCVQKTRIYSVGFSNGGGMSWLLSCQASDRIAAFAMVAGAFYYPEQACHPKQPSAILNIHGDKDTTVPYVGSKKRNLPDMDSWAKQRARLNGCNPTPVILDQAYVSTTTTWHDCFNNATVQNIRLQGIGHTWPATISIRESAKKKLSSKTPDILWRFFMNHSL